MIPNPTTNMNDDITFYMQGWEPEGKPKAIVCLLHGLGEHTGRYAHVGKALNDAGYALFGFDYRGHGQSGGARGHIPSLDIAMQDIHQFVGFQKQNFPNTPIFLYGHSLGGLFGLTYTIRFVDGIKGVIVTGQATRRTVQVMRTEFDHTEPGRISQPTNCLTNVIKRLSVHTAPQFRAWSDPVR